jgi:hypothetical protein
MTDFLLKKKNKNIFFQIKIDFIFLTIYLLQKVRK